MQIAGASWRLAAGLSYADDAVPAAAANACVGRRRPEAW